MKRPAITRPIMGSRSRRRHPPGGGGVEPFEADRLSLEWDTKTDPMFARATRTARKASQAGRTGLSA